MNDGDWQAGRPLAPGSTNYYLARFCPRSLRADVSVLLALGETLARIRHLSERHVALAKLAWWRTEIDRAPDHGSAHPLSTAVGEVIARRQLDRNKIVAIAEALEQHLVHPGYSHIDEIVAHHRAFGGGVADLINSLLNPDNVQEAVDCGAFFGAVDNVRQLGAEAGRITPLIPRSLLQSHGLASARELRSATPGLVETLCDQAAALRPADTPAFSAPLPAMLHLADALLDEIRSSGRDVLDAEIDLTPMRKLWIAWRSL